MTTSQRATKPGADFEVGDAVVFLGTEHRISEIVDYPNPYGRARIARDSTGWGITLFDEQDFEVAS